MRVFNCLASHWLLILIFLVGMMALIPAPAQGAVFCVSDSTSLQSALTSAGGNSEDDTIMVIQGLYLTTGASFSYQSSENYDIHLLGGFTPGCLLRDIDPTNTILDGQNSNMVLSILPLSGSTGDIHLQGFTIRNGNDTGYAPGGARISTSANYAGDITIDFNIFHGNHAAQNAGGLQAGADLGSMRFDNNLIYDNLADQGWGAGQILCNGTVFYVTNNTVTGNSCSNGSYNFLLSGSVRPTVSNNIVWGNDDSDFKSMVPALLESNDIGVIVGSSDPSSTGNISADPLFIGSGDYRLQAQSPAINAGTDSPGGGLPAQDLEGNARSYGPATDMGAYESEVLFANGFESGDLLAWSSYTG